MVISDVKTLVLIFSAMVAFANVIEKPEDLEWAIKSFILSGLISCFYIILVSDFSKIARFGRELGNVNSVGLMIGISFIFSVTEYIRNRKKFYLFALVPMLPVILMTGSRKSLLFIMIAIIYILYNTFCKNFGGKVKFLVISTLFALLLFYLVMEVPFFYNIIGVRIKGLIALFTGEGKVESSAAARKYMIDVGISLFKQRPLLGYGAMNYSVLFGELTGKMSYAHNNFIELLVNVGLIGTLTYYIGHFNVLKDLLFFAQNNENNAHIYAFISIILAYFFLGTGLVYYKSKHISFILAIASIIPAVYCKKQVQDQG